MSEKELAELVSQHLDTAPELIFTVKPKYLTSEDWENAIYKKPELFRRCKDKYYGLCIVALSLDGLNLEFIDPAEYTVDQYDTMCEIAVKQNPAAILLIPKEFRTRELRAYAYSKNPELALKDKKLTVGVVETMLDHNPNLIKDIDHPSDDLIIRALSKDPRVIVYFQTLSPRVKEFFEERYPQYAAMIIHD